MEQNKQEQIVDINAIVKQRIEKLQYFIEKGKNPFEIVKYDKTVQAKEIKKNFESLEGKTVKIAGRIIAKRVMGKASFIHILDSSDKIQSYVSKNDLGDEDYQDFKKFDIGDFIGIEGRVFATQTGEKSVHATSVILLSKSILPLPEKYHGLKDTELRYRQRYVDLIVNPEVRDTFQKRSKIISSIREYLDNDGFMEVETPVLNTIAGGASARPFCTHHNSLDIDMFMRIALELHLKRLIVGGFEKVYEIGRVFRNEGLSPKHNPEFTLLELYQAYVDYKDIMNLTENLIRYAALKVLGTGKIIYQGTEIDLEKPFERISMKECVKKYSNVDFDKINDLEEARKLAKEHNIQYEDRHLKGDILNLFFEKYCEEKLIQPTFVTDHPVEISPLAKKKPEDKDYTERFELFILGREHANAFSELNDPIDQRQRFERQAKLKAMGDEEASDVDDDFLTALEYGMPPTGGLGIGIDRLVMLLTDARSIRDVLLFPTMKPIK